MTDLSQSPRTVRVRISGFVQGVAYRAWTQKTARSLGLSGWVRNRADGSVEALVSGDPGAVRAMLARFQEGPRAARVNGVEVVEEGAFPPGSEGFEIKGTL